MIGRGRQRKKGVKILDEKFTLENDRLEFQMLERLAKRASKHREEHFPLENARWGTPIDVEVRRVGRFRSILEHVHPPGVFAARRHVIRNDVEDQTHAALAEFFAEHVEVAFGSEVWIKPRRIGDVVSVRAAAPRGQNRRSVNVRDTQIGKIVDDLCSVLKREILVELETIRREKGGPGWGGGRQ